jgi:hypothetical protein
MFHVKHFGTIGVLGKHTFAARGWVRSGDLEQAENCDRVYLFALRFLKNIFPDVKLFKESHGRVALMEIGQMRGDYLKAYEGVPDSRAM